MSRVSRDAVARRFAEIALDAGRAILAARGAGIVARPKDDGSPVTQADLDADACIRAHLALSFPQYPVVTEETPAPAGIAQAAAFILVDPLDGTKEFVTGRDEFTVNIALVDEGVAVAGAIYAPALAELFIGGETAGFARVEPAATSVPPISEMRARIVPSSGLRAVASRLHRDAQTQAWLDANDIAALHTAGSSLKFCAIARGEADVYPRMSPTMEWDIAAGDAILRAAGGSVVDLEGRPLRYGKHADAYRNGAFIAWGAR